MRTTVFSLALLAAVLCFCNATFAQGGLDRMAPETRLMFEEGRYFEMSWAAVSPDLNGSGGLFDPANQGTGDILESYDQWGFGLKTDLNERASLTLLLDQPWGANTFFPVLPTSGYSGTLANVDTNELSAILRRKIGNKGFSAYGGIRLQSIKARVAFPFAPALGFPGPYSIGVDREEGVGFMAGAAYEIPKIKLRASLTYYSEIDSTHDTLEASGPAITPLTTDITTPQSINLDFQSGIAKDTLAFGSIRWVDWSKFSVSPPFFSGATGAPLIEYTEDWITYTGGIGRRITDRFSLAFLVRYTPSTDQQLTTLGPIDGRIAYSIAPSFQVTNNVKLTVGVSYVDLGAASNFAGTQFDNGEAVAVGTRIGINF
jgi:long-subunit fatty acid transport protein